MEGNNLSNTQNLFGRQLMQGIIGKLMETPVVDWREHLTREYGDKPDTREYGLLKEINSLEQELNNVVSNMGAHYASDNFNPPTVTQVPLTRKVQKTSASQDNGGLLKKIGGYFSNFG